VDISYGGCVCVCVCVCFAMGAYVHGFFTGGDAAACLFFALERRARRSLSPLHVAHGVALSLCSFNCLCVWW
jgi:hypothetical protein